MAAEKVFVVLPVAYEDGLSVLSWIFRNFPQAKTEIIVTHVMSLRKDFFESVVEREKIDSIMDKYISHCATCKFRAEKLIHIADDIGEGIVQIIVNNEIKNFVMRAATNSDMTDLASETAKKVMREANRSCKLWFVSNGNLTFTREVNSGNLTPPQTSEEWYHWNGKSTDRSSSTFARSNSKSTTEKEIMDVDASLAEMLDDATIAANNFEKMADDVFGAHKKMAHLVRKLASKSQLKEEEITKLKENLLRERLEKDHLRRELNNRHKLSEEIEEFKIENNLLKRQIDEYLKQNQFANERMITLEKQVSDLQQFIKDLEVISASDWDCIDSLQVDLYNLQHERDNLVRKVEELCIQRENIRSNSFTALNTDFSLQELQQATENFSESLKIGEGGFGSVYKGPLRQTTVAIKLLDSQGLQGISQFQQEITILTNVRHPNLVTLIGYCSEVSALVYEYLSNGSLEDRLICANNTPPLTWQIRTRIIGEICLALIFLHSNKPIVVHGDLKPGNILLDTNLVSKLSDFGIAHFLKQPDSKTSAFFQASRPIGTFAYTDPEYLTTGILTPKSDIYSFGIVILQILTGKPPLNIAKRVKDALRDGILLSVIDESAGTWPFEQAKELAKIGLRCAELSRSQRPNLVNDVWAVVEPLMKAASFYVEPQSPRSDFKEESIPSHFICPILQEVMQDPHIAADGFTYEKDAIKQWLRRGHNTSPMTNLALPHRNLIPNLVLRSAIKEWLERHPQYG